MPSDLTRRASWGFYLAWLPMTALLLALLRLYGGRPVSEAAGLAVPLCVLYALVCRSSLYMCRVMPAQRSGLPRLIASHSAAALLASLLWVLVAVGVSRTVPLSAPVTFSGEGPLLFGIGVTYYLLAVVFHYLVLAMEASRQAEQDALQAHGLAREAELKALRAQLNPHFLFNSLHSISALATTDPPRARDMCISLSEFLRTSLRLGDREHVTVREELELARSYLRVEEIRFADRMNVTEEIDEECLEWRLPPLLLQPLVENAVKHGVAHRVDDGWVKLTVNKSEGRLVIVVENAFDADAPSRRAQGHGLSIVRNRLAVHFGPDARLEAGVSPDDVEVFRVQLLLPVGEGCAEEPGT